MNSSDQDFIQILLFIGKSICSNINGSEFEMSNEEFQRNFDSDSFGLHSIWCRTLPKWLQMKSMMNYSQEILFKFFFFVNSQLMRMNLSMNSTSNLNDFLQKSIHLLIICEYRVCSLDFLFDLTFKSKNSNQNFIRTFVFFWRKYSINHRHDRWSSWKWIQSTRSLFQSFYIRQIHLINRISSRWSSR